MTFATQFTDFTGVRWTVFESPASRITFDDRIVEDSPAHLTFEATVGDRTYLRRLRDYPHSWRSLSAAKAETISA